MFPSYSHVNAEPSSSKSSIKFNVDLAGVVKAAPGGDDHPSESELVALSQLTANVENRKCSYATVRDQILDLHGRLNDPRYGHGIIAPAYRPLVTPENFHDQPEAAVIIHDHWCIDLHWLSCSGFADSGFGSDSAKRTFRALVRDGIHAPEVDAFLVEANTTRARIEAVVVQRRRQLECIQLCDEHLRHRRIGLLSERDAHVWRLQEQLDKHDGREKNSICRVKIPKLCNVWLAREIALQMFRTEPTLALQADIYRKITGDRTGTRYSIRNQRRQLVRYFPGVESPNRPRLRPGTMSLRRAYDD